MTGGMPQAAGNELGSKDLTEAERHSVTWLTAIYALDRADFGDLCEVLGLDCGWRALMRVWATWARRKPSWARRH